MKRIFYLLGSCLFGMFFILSVFCLLINFGANIGLVVISFILFAGLLGYTIHDVLNVVDDLNIYKGKYRRYKKKIAELEEKNIILREEIAQYKSKIEELREEKGNCG